MAVPAILCVCVYIQAVCSCADLFVGPSMQKINFGLS